MKPIKKPVAVKRTRLNKKEEKKKGIEELRREGDAWFNRCLDSNDPPEFRDAYERMKKLGYDEEYTRQRIQTCFTFPRLQELINNEPFDNERYLRLLRALPYISPDETIKGLDMDMFWEMNARGEE
jgi:hypothetical protein